MRSLSLLQSAWQKFAGAAVLASALSLTPAATLAQSLYTIGSEGPAVAEIQRYLGISVDGIYGEQTAEAVANFQINNGLQVDGVAGSETLRAMGLENLLSGDYYPDTSIPFNPSNPSARSLPYVVAVPGNGAELLNRVRRSVPDAFLDSSRRGSYVQAGSFARRSDAERQARLLRQRDLDARVAYRP